MVHKRFVKKDGNVYGPYYYHNTRVDGKVVTSYHGKDNGKRNYKIVFLIVSIVLLAIVFVYLFYFQRDILFGPTKVSIEINEQVAGSSLKGDFFAVTEAFEPEKAKILFSLKDSKGNKVFDKEIPFSDVVEKYVVSEKEVQGVEVGENLRYLPNKDIVFPYIIVGVKDKYKEVSKEPLTNESSNETGVVSCVRDIDCGENGICIGGICVGGDYGSSERGCSGEVCGVPNFSIGSITCSFNFDCSQGQFCVSGVCSSTCYSNWLCGQWSACIGGGKTRTCWDRNNCGLNDNPYPTSQSCGGGGDGPCFLAGTEIIMKNGVKSIEEVAVGEQVLSFNEKSGVLEYSKVSKTFVHQTDNYLIFNSEIKVTPNHLFYLNGKWVEAGELKIGDILFGADGKYLLNSIEKFYDNVTVYNFEVDGNNNYFAEGVLVHNKIPPPPEIIPINPLEALVVKNFEGSDRTYELRISAEVPVKMRVAEGRKVEITYVKTSEGREISKDFVKVDCSGGSCTFSTNYRAFVYGGKSSFKVDLEKAGIPLDEKGDFKLDVKVESEGKVVYASEVKFKVVTKLLSPKVVFADGKEKGLIRAVRKGKEKDENNLVKWEVEIGSDDASSLSSDTGIRKRVDVNVPDIAVGEVIVKEYNSEGNLVRTSTIDEISGVNVVLPEDAGAISDDADSPSDESAQDFGRSSGITLTGAVVYKVNLREASAVVIYNTPSPTMEFESNEKSITAIIKVPDEIKNYFEDIPILAFAEIPLEWCGETIFVLDSEGNRINTEGILDKNSDDCADEINWIGEAGESYNVVIVITKAEHLDSNRSFISDIYESVKALDGNWSETINDGDFVRVTFERNLTSVNDITLYPRIVSGAPKIEVYEKNGNDGIALFENLIENEYNKIYLTLLNRTQESFDLRVVDGGVELEHIIDPDIFPSVVLNSPANNSDFIQGTQIILNASVSDNLNGLRVKIYTNKLSEGDYDYFGKYAPRLVYKTTTASIEENVIYNITALPYRPMESDDDYSSGLPFLLLHFDGENYSAGQQNGNISDFSGNGYASNFFRDAHYNETDAKFGWSLELDGYWDYVKTPIGADTIAGYSGGFTIATWIKCPPNQIEDSFGNGAFIVDSTRKTRLGLSGGVRIYLHNRKPVMKVNSARVNGTIEVCDNNWHYIVADYGNAILYVDGDVDNFGSPLVFQSAISEGFAGSGPILIGSCWDTECGLKGELDDFLIQDGSLSATQIRDLYKLGLGSYIWRANVSDADGNGAESEQRIFNIVDNSAAVINYGDGTESNNAVVERDWIFVNVTVNLVEDSITFKLFNSTDVNNISVFTNQQRTINWTGLAEGIYYYNVTVNDTLGNNYSTATRAITLNSTLPTVTLLSPSDSNTSIDRTPTFSWSGNGGDGSWTYDFNLTLIPSGTDTCSDPDILVEDLIGQTYTLPMALNCFYDNGRNHYYNWTVRAKKNGGTVVGDWATQFKLNLTSYIEISLVNANLSFENLFPSQGDNTTDNIPMPFILNNSGNVFVNISINASNLWSSVNNPSDYYQFKADNYSNYSAFNWTSSVTSFTPMPDATNPIIGVAGLNWENGANTCEVDVLVSVPLDEPPGDKNSSVTFIARAIE